MASNTYGAIKLSTAEDVGAALKKKTGSADGYKPKEWADTINLLGLLPIRTASGTIAHFSDGADDVPMKSVVANIVPIQEGTGTPSPSNPRPISGTSVLNVEQRRKNILNPNSEIVPHSTYGFFPLCPNNTPLTMTLFDNDTSVDISDVSFGFSRSLTENGAQSEISSGFVWNVTSGTITGRTDNVMSGKYCDQFVFYPKTQTTLEKIFQRFNIVVSVGTTTATTYEPYTGSTYAVNLGRTIYGGSADVVGGSGESEWGYIASYNGEVITEPWLSSIDAYAEGTLPSIGAEVVYKLATPESFTFTGQPINSYLGVNNVWTDSGEVLDVEYRADINLLISELGG